MAEAAAPRLQLANSFRPEEVRALCTLFSRLLTGGDVVQLVRSPAMRSAYAKFLRMREKLEGSDG
jgi:hypothetical protein